MGGRTDGTHEVNGRSDAGWGGPTKAHPDVLGGLGGCGYLCRMAEVAELHMTLAQFLSWDDGTDTRYQLIRGAPVAMAPPEEPHGTIVINIGAAIRAGLTPPCRVVGEAGIVPESGDDTYYQADLAVTCSPLAERRRYLAEPILIAEVFSPSTAMHDRGAKLFAYRRLPTVREILLVSSATRHVEHWTRAGEGWHVQDYIGDAVVPLGVAGPPLPLDTIYESVVLEADAS